jgi:Uma2 family endonuclease
MEPRVEIDPSRTYTEGEFLALGEDVRAELWDGELFVLPNPVGEHQDIALAIGVALRNPYHRGRGGPGGWNLLMDVDLRLKPKRIVRPDLSGWRRDRLPEVPKKGPIDVIPDWVCEVLSPSTSRHDRGRKLLAFAESGVGHAWIVDPVGRTVEVYVRKGRRYTFLGAWGDGDVVVLLPFDDGTIDVGDLFPPLLAHEPPAYAATRPRSGSPSGTSRRRGRP